MNTFGGPQRSLPGYPAAAAMTMPNRRSQAQLPARQGMMTPDGCLLWEVRLMKSKPEDRFGFAHFSGYGDFLRARNLLDPGEETPAATPVSTPGRNASKGETRSEFPRGKAPKVLVIREVALEGLLGGWNRAHPGSEVVAYDRIYAVNGKNRVEEMQQELRKSSQVTLRIVRYPQMFAVELRGDGSVPLPIGLQVERPPGGSAPELRVLEVQEKGALEQFNQAQIRLGRFHLVVLPGMFIRKANQAQGDPKSMEEVVAGTTPVTLYIRRGDQVPDSRTNSKR